MNFSGVLTIECVSLTNELCMIRPAFIDLNPVELNCYPFMISLDNCSGSCNSVDDLSTKICVLSETRDMNIEVFNMITNENEAKTMAKNISCDCKCNLNSTTFNSNQKWNNKKCQCECKKYRSCKNDYSWNPSTCICGKSKRWKRIVDDSVIAYDEIIYVMDIVSTNMTNTIPTNMTNTISTNVSTNSDGKKSKI